MKKEKKDRIVRFSFNIDQFQRTIKKGLAFTLVGATMVGGIIVGGDVFLEREEKHLQAMKEQDERWEQEYEEGQNSIPDSIVLEDGKVYKVERPKDKTYTR